MSARPNILIVMVDEQRFPTTYDDPKLRAWLAKNLPAQEAIRARSTELTRHYAGSVACVPSRATIFTGHYPTLHGVRATDGAAKQAVENDMYWLDPNTVPTMGDYFRAGGYRTYYHGKWHVSHADIAVPTSRDTLATNDAEGKPIPENVAIYRAAERLDDYGFRGWIGPDPHGVAQTNCGKVRDPVTADQVIERFDELEASDDDTPFALVCSFLNPHDITLFGALWKSFGYDFTDGFVPEVPPPPTQDEDLSTKPGCQADFAAKYARIFVPQPQLPIYRQFYYYLQKLVDEQVARVWKRFLDSRFAADTIVIFTSDHGEMLGAHGGQHQKWYQAYDECIRVPMYVSGPGIAAGRSVDLLSSHVDIIPTLLGLTAVDGDAARERLSRDHSEAQPLPGRDLTPVLRGKDDTDLPIYFMSEDEVSEGMNQYNFAGIPYKPVAEPAKVEAVLARLDAGDGTRLWKYVRTYQDSLINPSDQEPTGNEEFELYDLDTDPTEVTNLAWKGQETEESKRARVRLQALLLEQREAKAAHPTDLVTS